MNRAQLRHLVEKGSRRAKALHAILEKPEWLLSTTLLGTNFCVILLNAVVTLHVVKHFGHKYEFLTIFITFPLILIFGEVLPKSLFQGVADRIAIHLVYPLRMISIIFSPIVAIFTYSSRGFAKLLGIHSSKKTPILTREELELLFQASDRQTGIKDIERKMIDRIFSFSDRTARDIMIPLAEVISVREDLSIKEAAAIMRRSGFSRMPVYDSRPYHIRGWVNQYDLLFGKDKESLVKTVCRKVRFFPSTMRVDRLLFTMQKAGDTLAVVVDEYGGAIGLVTMEDVLEEIVGEIEDEHDAGLAFVRRVDAKRLVLNARIPILQLNDLLSERIPEGEYETLGGYLQYKMQKIPAVGSELKFRNLVFKVLTANERAVEEVEVIVIPELMNVV